MYNSHSLKFLLYSLITFVACMFYLSGMYYYELHDNRSNIAIVLFNGILFGSIASLIRISNNMFLGKEFSVLYMEMLYLFLLFFATIMYTVYFTNDRVHTHTYIIATGIIGLLITNHYLNMQH